MPREILSSSIVVIVNNNSNLHLFGAYYFPGTILSTTMSFDRHKNNFEVGTIIISIYHMGKPRLGKVITPFEP